MDCPVAPIIRGEFHYKKTLFVDCGGNLKTNHRASEAEIRRHVHSTSGQDQVAQWYEAQLVHYGFQRSKDKKTAKVRLHQALVEGKLAAQPPHLVEMEAQMKKEYAAVVRRVTKCENSRGREYGYNEFDPAENFRGTKVAVTIDGISIDSDRSNTSKTRPVEEGLYTNRATKTPTTNSGTSRTERISWALSRDQGLTDNERHPAAPPVNDLSESSNNVFKRARAGGGATANSHEGPKPTRGKQTDRGSTPTLGNKTESRLKEEPHVKTKPHIKTEPYDDRGHDVHVRDSFGPSDSGRNHCDRGDQQILDRGDHGQQYCYQRHHSPLGYNTQDNYTYTRTSTYQKQPDGLTGIYHIDCPQLAAQSP